jgi:hypothetical protein
MQSAAFEKLGSLANVKLKLSLISTNYHAIATYHVLKHHPMKTMLELHVFLPLALDGGERSVPRPGRFTPGKMA